MFLCNFISGKYILRKEFQKQEKFIHKYIFLEITDNIKKGMSQNG